MMPAKRIVTVEDEADLAELLAYNLRKSGYEVDIARDGPSGLRRIQDVVPDLAILDIMLPQMSGIQIARQIRTNPKTVNVPILFLTAKAEEIDQITGLQSGGDDYVTKPFSIKVLLARVEALLRRARAGGSPDGDVIEYGGIRVDMSTHELRVRGELVRVTLTEFRLVVALLRSRGKVLSRADLMYTAMGPDVLVTTRTIDVHVAAIRKKLGPCGPMIRTIRGVGYLLDENREGVEVGEVGEADELSGADEA